jgi:hypothetical protein
MPLLKRRAVKGLSGTSREKGKLRWRAQHFLTVSVKFSGSKDPPLANPPLPSLDVHDSNPGAGQSLRRPLPSRPLLADPRLGDHRPPYTRLLACPEIQVPLHLPPPGSGSPGHRLPHDARLHDLVWALGPLRPGGRPHREGRTGGRYTRRRGKR